MNYLRLPTGSDGHGWNPTSQHTEEKSKFLSYILDLTYHHLNFLASCGESKPLFCIEALSFAFKLFSNT